MTTALALPTTVHALSSLLGAGTLTFLVLLVVVAANAGFDLAPSKKRLIALCGLCTVIGVFLAAFVLKG